MAGCILFSVNQVDLSLGGCSFLPAGHRVWSWCLPFHRAQLLHCCLEHAQKNVFPALLKQLACSCPSLDCLCQHLGREVELGIVFLPPTPLSWFSFNGFPPSAAAGVENNPLQHPKAHDLGEGKTLLCSGCLLSLGEMCFLNIFIFLGRK